MRVRKTLEMFTQRETHRTNMQLVPCLLLCFELEITASQSKSYHLLCYKANEHRCKCLSLQYFFHWLYSKAQYHVPVCHRCRISSFGFKPTLKHKHHCNLLGILKKKKDQNNQKSTHVSAPAGAPTECFL